MSDIILFHFKSSEIRYVGDGINHWWVASDVCSILCLGNVSHALSRLDEDEKGIISNDRYKLLTINESGLYSLILGSRKKEAKVFKRWITHEVLPSIRKTGQYSIDSFKSEIERQFLPVASLKEIDQAAKILGKRFGKAYEESYLQQMFKTHQPHLIGPNVEAKERSPLKSAEALLTPTEIGVEIGVLYPKGGGNARWVNNKLAELGYQEKIQDKWSATQKGKAHSDRKPVDTDSRSDKDQLMWYSSVVPVLAEHVTTGEAA